MRRPLICLLISFIAGILAGSFFAFSYNVLMIAAFIMLVLIFASIRNKWHTIGFLVILIFLFILGIFNIQKRIYFFQDEMDVLNYVNSEKISLEGSVIESPIAYPDKNVLIVKCARVRKDKSYLPTSGNIRLAIPSDLTFHYGDFIRFRSSLRTIKNFNNPGCFNYEQFMKLQGIYASGFINDNSDITLLRKDATHGIRDKLESFRTYLKQIIQRNSFSPEKEIIEAMTLGNQSEIPAVVRENFNKTGTSHILSISGLHVGMVAAIFFAFIFFALKSSEYLMLRFNIIKLAAATAFIIVLLYSFIAGLGTPVMRATLMAFIFLIAILSGKQKDMYNTLALAGLIILSISPEALFDISFQLSFMSVWAIIYIVPRFSNLLPEKLSLLPHWIQFMLRYIYLTVVVCIAATIGTFPLILHYFDRVSLVTIIANIIAVPLLGTLTLAVSMFFILFSFTPEISGYFVQVASFFTQISVSIINKLASLPFSSVSIVKPNIIEITVFYFSIFLAVRLRDEKKSINLNNGLPPYKRAVTKYFLILAIFFLVADITYFTFRDKISPELKITIIDVGQGNSTLVQFPNGENMIIDGGGFSKSNFDVGKGVVAPFLYTQRIRNIKTVVLSHPHPDHLLGLIYILNNFNVRQAWKTNLPVNPEIYPEWEKTINSNKINPSLISIKTPEKIINGVRIKFLWPPDYSFKKINKLSFDEENDSSMVLKITYGMISFLIPGDISSDIEKKLIKSKADLKSDVLVIPHHGSNNSSSAEFIRAVACRYAVVSAGKSNVFKHPHTLVLQRYKNAGVNVLRTDLDGAITFKTNGNNLYVNTFLKN